MNCRIGSFVFLMMLSVVGFGQKEFKFKATLDKDTILIGEQAKLKLEFDFSKRLEHLGWPQYKENRITDKIEIVSATAIDSTINPTDNNVLWSQILTITSFDSGVLTIPQIPIAYKNLFDTAVIKSYTDSLRLVVITVDADTTQAFKDIVAPRHAKFSFSEIANYVMWGVIALLILLLAYYVYRRIKKKKPIIPVKEEPLVAADVEALTKLEKLRREQMWQGGLVKEYYTELTDIIRLYIERRFEIQAAEMTSDEIIDSIKKVVNNDRAIELLALTFDTADLVKFAKLSPMALENDLCLQRCIDFVNETKVDYVR